MVCVRLEENIVRGNERDCFDLVYNWSHRLLSRQHLWHLVTNDNCAYQSLISYTRFWINNLWRFSIIPMFSLLGQHLTRGSFASPFFHQFFRLCFWTMYNMYNSYCILYTSQNFLGVILYFCMHISSFQGGRLTIMNHLCNI